MNILIIDGWTTSGNDDHGRAGCKTQAELIKDLVNAVVPEAHTTIIDSNTDRSPDKLVTEDYAAAIWSGGGGNIYVNNAHNRHQLALCETVLSEVPKIWGSCWGLQVLVSVCGGKVSPSATPEIGIATDISYRMDLSASSIYRGKDTPFDAPAHHYDEVLVLPDSFDIVAENANTLQAVASKDGRIFCTQYHPELPYDYLRQLLAYWAVNYQSLFSQAEFEILLRTLEDKERIEHESRSLEIRNWLTSLLQS